ncbi:MAG: NAD-dependent epimerase/dehydratase family protein [Acidimicrobiales bacterium]
MDLGLTGATGHLGSVLLPRLLSDPRVDRVRSVARRALAEHPKLHHVRADLRTTEARHALAGVDVLVHLGFTLWRRAGMVGLSGAEGPMLATNAEMGANVLGGAPGRIVLASSVAVYGAWPGNPTPISEELTPRPNPECRYAADKLSLEGLCAETAPSTILRLSAVLGPSADPRIGKAARGYRVAVPAVAGAAQALQFLDEVDAAAALQAAVHGAPSGVCNAATSDWLSAADVAAVCGGRVVTLPRRALLAAAEAARLSGAIPFGSDRAVLLCGPLAVSSARAGRLLGWRAERTSAQVLGEAVVGAGASWRSKSRQVL